MSTKNKKWTLEDTLVVVVATAFGGVLFALLLAITIFAWQRVL